MKVKYSIVVKVISLILVSCMLFLVSCSSLQTVTTNKPEFLKQEDAEAKALREEIGIEVEQNPDNTISYSVDNEYAKCELKYNEETGEFFYADNDGQFPLQITNVTDDGIMHWKVEKENETLEGEVDTSGAATPQFALAIAGTSVVVSAAVYYAVMWAGKIVIAGATCYVASKVADIIKSKAARSDFFPAYLIRNNVYVAANIGLSFTQATIRIRLGQSVWAKSEYLAYSVCINASPIMRAEYGWHGNQRRENGYYPHYHAVRFYISKREYVHTGAHCWF